MSSESALFVPYTFRSGATAQNRVTLAPLTNQQSFEDGRCSIEELDWLERRAQGGFALVMTCASYVSPTGKAFAGQLGCSSNDQLPGLRNLSDAIHRHAALALVQLHHAGSRSPAALIGQQPISASAVPEAAPNRDTPRAATSGEIEQIIEDFCVAAHRAHRAGFDGIELHGAHGYLFTQFLSTVSNQRSDDWGGTLAARARLLRTVAARIRTEIPKPFIVGVRLSPEDNSAAVVGIDLDESLQVAQWLAADGVDFIDLSLWDFRRPTRKRPDRFALPLFREALPQDVALFAAGAIWNRDDVQAVLSQGADFASLGKAAILNPDWPRHVHELGYQPRRGPLTPEQLEALAISPPFVEYLRRFKGLVAEPAG
jgi:2,4-dienoyl-CoA reductase-like NADH-dependent reductase (Old Yellow Enzyme family)